MKRKALFIVFALLSLLCITTTIFATNDMKNGVNNAAGSVVNGVERLGNDVRSGIGTAEGAIENGAKNLGNTVSQGIQDIGNALTSDTQNMTNTTNTGYTATRTTASDITNTGTGIMDSNVWTWVIVAVAGAVIVGLVWYYAKEHEER